MTQGGVFLTLRVVFVWPQPRPKSLGFYFLFMGKGWSEPVMKRFMLSPRIST